MVLLRVPHKDLLGESFLNFAEECSGSVQAANCKLVVSLCHAFDEGRLHLVEFCECYCFDRNF